MSLAIAGVQASQKKLASCTYTILTTGFGKLVPKAPKLGLLSGQGANGVLKGFCHGSNSYPPIRVVFF